MPGLDVLRGVAVLAVVLYHGLYWWPPRAISVSHAAQRLSSLASPGWMGVNLFFVLSGFLITGILLDTRNKPHYWKSFYTRRALRILPLYIATLVVVRFYEGLGWPYLLLCLLFLANFASVFQVASFGPLWSLAVEEQFYLVWPFLVRRLRLRSLAIVCLGSILLSPLLRYLSVSRLLPLGDPHLTTWLLSDNIAAGGLIAILLRTPFATLHRVRALTLAAGSLGAASLALGLRLHLMNRATAVGAALQPEPFLLIFVALLLLSLIYGRRPLVFRLTGPLRFYGYISYGLYLLHLVGFKVYQAAFSDPSHPLPLLTAGGLLLRFGCVLAAATLVCFLSRRYFEEYFLRLKDRLAPYPSPRKSR
jgi:peptidoglycan/LPS O-acetylase OafA/YrhL